MLLATIVVVLFAIGGTWYYLGLIKKTTKSKRPTKLDISPWQLYHNSKYQISFYYPKDWNVEHLPTALDGKTHQDNIFEIGEL